MWLIHQHRTAYELWDHPVYADLSRQDDGAAVRDMVWNADRLALERGQARLHELQATCKERLWSLAADPRRGALPPVAASASTCWTVDAGSATATTSCSPAGWRA